MNFLETEQTVEDVKNILIDRAFHVEYFDLSGKESSNPINLLKVEYLPRFIPSKGDLVIIKENYYKAHRIGYDLNSAKVFILLTDAEKYNRLEREGKL